MHPYGVGDVEKLLGLPRSTIRALIAAGFARHGALIDLLRDRRGEFA